MEPTEKLFVGPFHCFWLCSVEERLPTDHPNEWWGRQDFAAKIPDDLLHLVWKTIERIPSLNPYARGDQASAGFNPYGATVFSGEGAQVLALICEEWRDLFSAVAGPFILLSGFYELSDEQGQSTSAPIPDWRSTSSSELSTCFENVRRLASEASRNSRKHLLHIGV